MACLDPGSAQETTARLEPPPSGVHSTLVSPPLQEGLCPLGQHWAILSPWLGCQLQSTLLLPKACPKILNRELTSAHHVLKSAFCRAPSSPAQTKPGFKTQPSPGEAGGRLLSHLANSSIFPAAHSTGGASTGSCEHSPSSSSPAGPTCCSTMAWQLSALSLLIPWLGEVSAAEEAV